MDPKSSADIWVLDRAARRHAAPIGPGDPRARPFVKSNFAETQPTLSPDGQWLAYQSNESGRFEVYARPFPDGGPAQQISTEGARVSGVGG